MPKSKHRKEHKSKLTVYKANKKQEQEALKKKLMENYIKMQQDALQAQDAHSSIEEVSGVDVDVSELNEDWNQMDQMDGNIETTDISVDPIDISIVTDNVELDLNTKTDDNNN